MSDLTAPVSERALMARINRRLDKGVWPESLNSLLKNPGYPHKMFKSRSGGELSSLGRFYVVDTYTNTVKDSHIDLEQFAHKMEVMANWETLAD